MGIAIILLGFCLYADWKLNRERNNWAQSALKGNNIMDKIDNQHIKLYEQASITDIVTWRELKAAQSGRIILSRDTAVEDLVEVGLERG